ncbi:MAG: hypothetical protein IT366_16425 [Candidatus Hydrogenedentes bacterium]|nr:hypothetical protein [Candidatus Hydrogenedentota bacterium]
MSNIRTNAWKAGSIAASFIAGAILSNQVSLKAEAVTNVLRATKFELIDGTGRVMGVFGSADGKTPQLQLLDEAGKPRIHMGLRTSNGEPEFTLNGKDGKKRAWLSLTSVGGANLMLIDNKERARINMLTTPEGDPFIHFLDANEIGRASYGITNEGIPMLELHDAEGNVRAALHVEADGKGALTYPEPKPVEPPKEGEAP